MEKTDNRKKQLTPELLEESKKLKSIFESKKKDLKISQGSIADFMGINQSSVSHYLNGLNPLNANAAAKFAKILQVDINEFSPRLAKEVNNLVSITVNNQPNTIEISTYDENDPVENDEVVIPIFKDVQLSAGCGRVAISELQASSTIRFKKNILIKQGVSFNYAICVTVSGNSMEPFIQDGALVGIDIANTNIVDGKIYAVVIENDLARVKQLYRLPNNRVRLRSFNRDEYEDEDYSLEDIRVVGKVFWSSVLWD
ncbi:transcriptional regulator [Gammaproteobacteria bacterium ESL0073]|nr:transcriptional regulator [Gammaproteobacteria bacterium ESL0073]